MVFWKTKEREYWKSEVSDEYLMNIARFLERASYLPHWVTEEMVDGVFEECFVRGLLDADTAHRHVTSGADVRPSMEQRKERRAMERALFELRDDDPCEPIESEPEDDDSYYGRNEL